MSDDDRIMTQTTAYASVLNAAALMEAFDNSSRPDDDVLEDHLAAAIAMTALVANGAKISVAAALAHDDKGKSIQDALSALSLSAKRLSWHFEIEEDADDAVLFRYWIHEAGSRPSRLASALCDCLTLDDYRKALRRLRDGN